MINPSVMKMEMNLSPMTKEIEKLRTYIGSLVDSMAQNQRIEVKGVGNQLQQIREIKELLNGESVELHQKLKEYSLCLQNVEKQNQDLKLENVQMQQKLGHIK